MSLFTVKNESFTCEHCKKEVLALKTGCRNHCPFCFYSKHIDIYPGDRANECRGLMKPVGYEHLRGFEYKVILVCEKCGGKHRNKCSFEDPVQPDDLNFLIQRLTPKP